jgi:hypothetical protein
MRQYHKRKLTPLDGENMLWHIMFHVPEIAEFIYKHLQQYFLVD